MILRATEAAQGVAALGRQLIPIIKAEVGESKKIAQTVERMNLADAARKAVSAFIAPVIEVAQRHR